MFEELLRDVISQKLAEWHQAGHKFDGIVLTGGCALNVHANQVHCVIYIRRTLLLIANYCFSLFLNFIHTDGL